MDTARHLEAQAAEEAVLGTILLDNSVYDQVAGRLSVEDFYHPRHQVVFRAMGRLYDTTQPIDEITLEQMLGQMSELQAAGGLDFLLTLRQAKGTALNIDHYCELVREQADIRRLIKVCREIEGKASSGDYDDASRLFDEAQQVVYEVGQRRATKGFSEMKEALQTAIAAVKKAHQEKKAVTGTPTGYHGMDRKTAGFQRGDLIILAARPGMGKTALALNLATNAASLSGESVALFSLEMPTAQLATRMIASEAKVDSERMRTGFLQDSDIDKLLQAFRRMQNWPVFIDDTAGLSLMELRAKCRRLASDSRKPRLGLIIVDYLQLMKGRPGVNSREQEISEISRGMKGLAKELMVPVVALSQLNRGVESRPNKRPQLSDLRESGAIEQDADIIIFVYRDEYYNENSEKPGVAEIIFGKNRSGSTGTVDLAFIKQYTRFENLAREQ